MTATEPARQCPEPCGTPRGGADAKPNDPGEKSHLFGRPRDIFPLPTVPTEGTPPNLHDLSRGCQRRHLRHHHQHDLVCEVAVVLNDLFLGPRHSADTVAGNMRPTAAQGEVFASLRSAVKAFGSCPQDISGPGALRELRAMPSYEGEPTCLAPLQVDLVSLPPAGSSPVGLFELCGEPGINLEERLLQMRVPDVVGAD